MSKARGCGVAAMAMVLFCGLGGWGLLSFSTRSAQAELQAELARSTKLGLPPKMTDLWPAPKNPSQNAALTYTRLSRGGTFSKAREAVGKVGYPETAADIRAIDAGLALAEPEFSEFVRAAALPECRFQRKPSIDVLFPEFAVTKAGVNLLAFRARNEAAKGDPVRGMRTLALAANVSKQIGQESVLIAKLVQIAEQAIVIRAAQEVLADHGRRADVRAEARKMLAALGPDPNMREGMKGEWMFQREAPRALETGKLDLNDLAKMASGAASPGSVSGAASKWNEVKFVVAMKTKAGRVRQELNATRTFLDYYQAIPSDPTLVEPARKASKDLQDKLDTGGSDMVLAQILMPVFSQANDAAAKGAIERRLFTALLNALDAPVPPKKLPLKGNMAIDPFDMIHGTPYRYRATKKEIRIWSVGQDGSDDGGPLDSSDRNRDITIAWPYPKSVASKR
ncbi:hypothetical protein EON79_09015 [bacterium]|nr:MAG: hypothetical protein EON79_09015 [bacterium]